MAKQNPLVSAESIAVHLFEGGDSLMVNCYEKSNGGRP